jgi:hypothetical protein
MTRASIISSRVKPVRWVGPTAAGRDNRWAAANAGIHHHLVERHFNLAAFQLPINGDSDVPEHVHVGWVGGHGPAPILVRRVVRQLFVIDAGDLLLAGHHLRHFRLAFLHGEGLHLDFECARLPHLDQRDDRRQGHHEDGHCHDDFQERHARAPKAPATAARRIENGHLPSCPGRMVVAVPEKP